jgi:hypothetical protein
MSHNPTLVSCRCEFCGEKFFVKPCRVKAGRGRFCSSKCFGAQRTKNFISGIRSKRPNKPRVKCECKFCGKEFLEFASKVDLGWGKFCSKECSNDGRDRTPIEDRFFNHVGEKEENGCILWTGAIDQKGYGNVSREPGKYDKAHRVAWELAKGPIPDGLFVCHDCPGGDNPRCVNPEHLFLGTAKDNSEDMVDKGRSCYGEKHGQSKLTEDQVSEIISKYSSGKFSQSELAKMFNISQSSISFIIRGVNWKHLNQSV